jgi:hypothetical protein
MNAKTLIFLAGGTALLGGAALLMDPGRGGKAAQGASEALVPDLAARADAIARIEIEGQDGTLALALEGDSWGLADLLGYPVQAEKVRTLLAAFARSERMEPKTSNPDRYGDLGLADVQAEGSSSSRLRLLDANGEALGDVIVGKRRPTGDASYYARIPGESRTWLASGELRLSKARREWLDTSVAKIERKRIVGLELTHPDGEVVLLERLEEADDNLSITNPPDGMVPSSEWITSRFGTALEFLTLEDIEPRAKRVGERTRAVFRTRDGLVLEFRSLLRAADAEAGTSEQLLVDLTASYDENPPLPWAGPLAPGVEPVADLTADEEPAEEAQRTPEEVQAEVAALNERFAEWTIVLAGYRKNVFQARMSELVKEAPAEEEAPPVTPEDGPIEDGHEGHDHGPGEHEAEGAPEMAVPQDDPAQPEGSDDSGDGSTETGDAGADTTAETAPAEDAPEVDAPNGDSNSAAEQAPLESAGGDGR